MSTAEEQPTTEQRPAGIGPGERLQAARIQQGLSLEEVANRMHLSPNILEALEENNFEEITAPIFVKGYLRAYARIVGLDENDMIQQYVQFYSEEDPPITSTSNVASELSVADARIKWTTYLVVVVLAALLAAWWWNKEQSQPAPISLDSQGDIPAAVEPAAGGDSEIEAVSEERAEPMPLPATEAPAEILPAAETEPAPAAESVPQAAAGEPSAPAVETQAVEPAATVEAAPEPVGEAAPEAAGEAAPEPAAADSGAAPEAGTATPNRPDLVAPTGTDKLQISLNADSWADIKDSTGFQMVYDLLRAGRTLELTGSAPFSVFLGDGRGVEIRLNGEVVDFSARIRNDNTARLRIGG